MDFADASLVAVADAENINTIFTLDKDFKVYRIKRTGVLNCCQVDYRENITGINFREIYEEF